MFLQVVALETAKLLFTIDTGDIWKYVFNAHIWITALHAYTRW